MRWKVCIALKPFETTQKAPSPLPLSPRKKRSGRGESPKFSPRNSKERSPLPECFLRRLEGFILKDALKRGGVSRRYLPFIWGL